jgi:hypothetical protein
MRSKINPGQKSTRGVHQSKAGNDWELTSHHIDGWMDVWIVEKGIGIGHSLSLLHNLLQRREISILLTIAHFLFSHPYSASACLLSSFTCQISDSTFANCDSQFIIRDDR